MINYIEGRLVERTPTYAVIDCNGVGYICNISLNTFSKIGEFEKCKLFTLYGFAEESERYLFRHLISVSGVGAGTARMILSSLSPEEILQAIVTANVVALKSIKGIGEKSAQRIIVDLKGRLGKDELTGVSPISFTADNRVKEEALSALVMLGFVKSVAEKAVDKILKTGPKDITVEQLIKLALKNL